MFNRARKSLIFAFVLFAWQISAQAQPETPKAELGVHYTTLKLNEYSTWDRGVGGRVGFNLNRYLALEAEMNYLFSNSGFSFAQFNTDERRLQGLFGVKAGARGERFGVFGKARPGFLRTNQRKCGGVVIDGNCFGALIPGNTCRDSNGNIVPCPQSITFEGSTNFAFDLGGVLEIYMSRRLAFRMDLGDTILRNYGPNDTSHNFQLSTGVSIRF